MRILITAVFFLLSIQFTIAQESPYHKQWVKVDTLELRGQVKTALSIVDSIISNSIDQNHLNDYVKASVFRWKFLKITEEDIENSIVQEIEEASTKMPAPQKAIFKLLKAELLTDYYSNNGYKINSRTNVSQNSDDIGLWSGSQFIAEIVKTYKEALTPKELLLKTPVSSVETLVLKGLVNRHYKPTLYDLIAQEAMSFYKIPLYGIDRPEFFFEINDPSFFSSSEEFRNIAFKTKDTLVSNFNAIKLMQDIETIHAEDKDPSAYVYAQLERLKFVKQYYAGNAKNELYEKQLYTLSRKHNTNIIQGIIQFEIANHYVNLARTVNSNNKKTIYKGYYLKAKEICKNLIEKYPNSEASVRASQLLKVINQTELSIKIKTQVLPNKANRMLISYKNIDTLKVKIVKISSLYDSNNHYNLGADFWNIIHGDKNKNSIVDSLVYVLPMSEDADMHTTEVLLPKLPKGKYLIYADNEKLKASKDYAFGFTKVSQMGYVITNYTEKKVFRFYDELSGMPLENVKVSSNSITSEYVTSGITDAYGEYVIEKGRNKNNRYNNSEVRVTAVYNNDTIFIKDRIYPSYSRDGTYKKQYKAEIFLDRGIYRPGQPMYFKGILLQREDKKSTIVPQQKAIVYIEGVNGDELLKREVVTNEYGSFSGEFTIPEDILTGSFRIYVGKKSAPSGFWGSAPNHGNGHKIFKIEAYKRPTFEVTFDSISKTYQPNDMITVTGNAKAFLGANITLGKGTYRISRKKVSRYWYYYTNRDEGRSLTTGDFITDSKGNFKIEFIADYEGQSVDTVFEFFINVSVTDLNGETHDALKKIKVSSKNLLTTLTVSEQVEGGKPIELTVENKNLNDIQVACDNTIKIFKLDTPNRILFDRLWKTPEYQQISKQEFQEAFPNELYDLDSIPKTKGVLVFEKVIENIAQYKETIPTSVSWEAGTYIIEHTAQSKEGVSLMTEERFVLSQPNQKYLPKDELFSYKMITENPREDGFVEVILNSSLQDLSVFIDGFYKQDRFYKKQIVLDGKEKIKIQLDKNFEKEITIRLKYTRYGQFFHENIPVDISIPKETLEVETQTFRSKLYPDSKEKWSFKIKNSNDKKVKAEVLASMYDKSLDTYAKSYWNSKFDIREYSNTSIPSIERGFKVLVNYFRVINKRRTNGQYESRFDRVYLFGLNFYRSNYSYNNYLRIQRRAQKLKLKELDFKIGNTIGIVLDTNGDPLPGAVIRVKGTKKETETNANGEFSIAGNPSDMLVVSYEGFVTKEIVLDHTIVYITLEGDPYYEEIIITAQGIKREKKTLGYAVSEVETEVLNELSVPFSVDSEEALKVVDTVSYNFESDKALVHNAEIENEKEAFDFKGVKIRKNLNETAFFYPHITTNRKGEIKFTFDAPQLLTQWRFRLLAHTKDVITGGIEKEVITQKDLSLVPNAPRFLREGDMVELSAKIANLTAREMKGGVQLQLFDAITMKPIDAVFNNTNATQEIHVNPYGNTSVFWKLDIPSDIQAVTYRMVAKAGKFSDGEENILPILPNRMLVTESVPFLVRAGEDRTITMDHFVNTTSKTLKHQKFALEYTSNPSWYALQALPYLMEFPHECAEQTFSRMYANSISTEILNSNPVIKEVFESWKGDGVLQSALEKNEDLKSILIAETPWLRDAQSETEKKKRLGLLFDIEKNAAAQIKTLAKLKEMQYIDGGFPWFSGGSSNYYITRHIVSGMGHLQKLGIDVQAPEMLENAIDYLDIELEKKLEKYLKYNDNIEAFYARRSHMHFLYARSFFLKEYPLPVKVREILDASLKLHNDAWFEKTTYEKGLLSLVNYRVGNKEMAVKILTGLRESAVQSEINGMYWKDNRSGWYWYQAPIETQALLIEAFEEVMDDEATVEELKIWLLQQKRTGDWKTTKATANAIYALLLTGTSFVTLEDNTQFKIQNTDSQKRLDQASKEAGTGYLKATWNKEEVTTSLGNVAIKNNGTTVGYGGMYWQYFEDLDKIEKAEGTVLNMTKSLFLVHNDTATEPLEKIEDDTILELGQTVKVRLTIKVKSNMEFIHLKDMRASGLEPIDVLSQHKYQDGLSYYQSTRDTATHFFFDNLPMGTYVLEYDLRVNNKGQFSNGISTIQSMYAPEFSNNTAGMKVIIK